ncbi:multidrug resistance protein NorM [Clostridium tepidiprofundi DSM 19306]|uniref:Probable multidrug resistance protein NorM n=1 Tax=Clostridium tepidiprofundi DSM 19306 TaxID=1121338 RepID=A0A151B6X0_9CLOT|nr:MATE family efflux transporter [Clostridium tepidiprofundi]KYH35530.1 multidrug resistance protein NorM [Clostridium tepidiprofundi DSM 19306]
MINRENVKDVLTLALPAVGEMILYMMIWVFDTMMLGKYGGKLAVSAVGLSSEIIYTFVNILISTSIAVGVTSLVARRVGAKEYDGAEEYATLSLVISIGIALVLSAIFFIFSKEILVVAKADNSILSLGVIYMKICSIGIFFSMLTTVLNAVLRGTGNTKTPLIASFIINLINITLDWLLIFGHFGLPKLGTKGAAIATSTANFIGFLFIFIYVFKRCKIKPRIKYIKKFNIKELKELLTLSIPSGLQESAFSICRLINMVMIMTLGDIAFSANQITTTIESLSFMPGWGFAVAATTLVGHKIGEKDYKKAKEYGDTCIFLGMSIMAVCAVLFVLFPNFLISLFIKEDEIQVIKLGASCLMIASLEQIPTAISMVVGGALKGSGDTRRPFLVAFISNWVIRLPLMYYFIYLHKSPVTYVWWITAIQWTFDGSLIFIMYRRKFSKAY